MDATSLDERARLLDKRLKDLSSQPLTGFRLDLIRDLIKKLEANGELETLLGGPVCERLAIVWDKANDEVLLADARAIEERKAADLKFMRLLREMIDETMEVGKDAG
jgi:hypothetical protein